MATVISRAELLLQAKYYDGSGDWLDRSGNGHDATPLGSPVWNGSHFTFNAIDQAFTVANHANLNFGTGVDSTLMVRMRAADTTPAGTSRLIGKGAGNVNYYIELRIDGTARCYFNAGSYINDATAALTNNTIHVITGVRDAATNDDIEAYLDGTGSGTPTPFNDGDTSNGSAFMIASAPFGLQYFAGDVFDVVVWREALPPADVVMAGLELETRPAVMGGSRLAGVGSRLRGA